MAAPAPAALQLLARCDVTCTDGVQRELAAAFDAFCAAAGDDAAALAAQLEALAEFDATLSCDGTSHSTHSFPELLRMLRLATRLCAPRACVRAVADAAAGALGREFGSDTARTAAALAELGSDDARLLDAALALHSSDGWRSPAVNLESAMQTLVDLEPVFARGELPVTRQRLRTAVATKFADSGGGLAASSCDALRAVVVDVVASEVAALERACAKAESSFGYSSLSELSVRLELQARRGRDVLRHVHVQQALVQSPWLCLARALQRYDVNELMEAGALRCVPAEAYAAEVLARLAATGAGTRCARRQLQLLAACGFPVAGGDAATAPAPALARH
jgi:DNA-binding NarL/FixJ family response regulator